MLLAFTICSNNYLSEAITLGSSLVLNGMPPDNFFIFLVDIYHKDIPYDQIPFSVLEVNDQIVPEFDKILNKFNIVELNTSVKPSIFKYLISHNPGDNIFAYIDPDVFFYHNSFDSISQELADNSILLTPHITRPLSLNTHPFESIFLNYGIYNLGFIAMKADDQTAHLLDWWEERTINLGFNDVSKGLFVDQLWMNLAPIFFDRIKITKHPGYNIAYWNINERHIFKKDNLYFVDINHPLIFFHFSSFDMSLCSLSKRVHNKPEFNYPILNELMELYKLELEKNGYYFYRTIIPAYNLSFDNYIRRELNDCYSSTIIKFMQKYRKYLPIKIIRKIAYYNKLIEALDKWN